MTDIERIYPDRPEILGEMAYDELRQLVFDVVHGTRTLGPPLDPRLGVRPFERLAEVCLRGDRVVRERLAQILREFLAALVDTQTWPEDARADLLNLIQDCGAEVLEDLRTLVRQKTLLDAAAIGRPGHAGLLKCMLSLGAYATPGWWLEQSQLLGEDYGALVFSGLVEHGLEAATAHLPTFCASPVATREIAILIPGLIDQFGLERVRDALAKQLPHLSPAVAAALEDALGYLQAEDLAMLVANLLKTYPAVIQDPPQFERAVFTSLHRLVLDLGAPWGRLSGTAPADLVLFHLANLSLLIAPLISGDHAASFLWQACNRLYRILTGNAFVPEPMNESEFYEFCRHDAHRRDDVLMYLNKLSRPEAPSSAAMPQRELPR